MIEKAKSFISYLKKESERDEDRIADYLETILEQYYMDDGFGSEGQSDPRGDFRDGSYNMWDVEGDEEIQSQHERNELVLDRMLKLFEEDEYFTEYVLEMKESLPI